MDQLTQVSGGTGTIGFEYDALGRRASETRSVGSTYFVNAVIGGQSHTIGRTSSSGETTWSAVYSTVVDEPLAETGAHGGAQYLYRDALGSVVASADGDGLPSGTTQFSPYGEVVGGNSTPASTEFGFTGRESIRGEDVSYFRARYYDSGIKRFLTQDSYLGELGTPLTLNRYSYVQGDPLNLADPTGRTAAAVHGARLLMAAVYLGIGQTILEMAMFFALSVRGDLDDLVANSAPGEDSLGLTFAVLGNAFEGGLIATGILTISLAYVAVGARLLQSWRSSKSKSFCGEIVGFVTTLGISPVGSLAAATYLGVGIAAFQALKTRYQERPWGEQVQAGAWFAVAAIAAYCLR